MLAVVVATYGYPAGGMRAMPWWDFCCLWREVGRVRTWGTVSQAHGVALGAALALNGKDGGAQAALAKMEREALRG